MNHSKHLPWAVVLGLSALLWSACSTAPPPAAEEPPGVVEPTAAPEGRDEAREVAASGGGAALGDACGPAHGACGDDGYCLFPADAACGEGGAAGVCTARPRGCKRDCPAVCGCEGEFYCNACVAHAQGRAVRHAGRCEGSPAEPAGGDGICKSETGKVIPCE